MKYVVPQEIGGFKIALRSSLTLAATDPITGLTAAPGGGQKPQDKCLMATIHREGREEHGADLTFLLAHSLPLFLYLDIQSRRVVSPQTALTSAGVKLHMWVLMVETSGLEPQERRPKEFKSPAFFPQQHFHDRKSLRPSLDAALKHFQGKGLWPKVSVPGQLIELNTDYMRMQLEEMRLEPRRIETIIAAHCAAA